MMKFRKAVSVGLVVGCAVFTSFGMSSPAFAESFAGLKLSKEHCLAGDEKARTKMAQGIFEDLTLECVPEQSSELSVFFKNNSKKNHEFMVKLGVEMKKRGCAFSKKMDFSTVSETLASISEKTFQLADPSEIPSWMQPGFTAVLAGYDSDSTLVIETSQDGFIFHRCERDDTNPTSVAPPPSLECPLLFNSAVFIPVDRLLLRAGGVKYAVLSVLKAVASVSVVVTSNLGLAAISPIAQTAVNLVNPTPIADLRRDQQVKQAIQDLLEMGNVKNLDHQDGSPAGISGPGGAVVTRLFPFKYDDMKQAMIDVNQGIEKSMYRQLKMIEKDPENPNMELLPALAMERKFRDLTRANFGKPAPVDSGK